MKIALIFKQFRYLASDIILSSLLRYVLYDFFLTIRFHKNSTVSENVGKLIHLYGQLIRNQKFFSCFYVTHYDLCIESKMNEFQGHYN